MRPVRAINKPSTRVLEETVVELDLLFGFWSHLALTDLQVPQSLLLSSA